MAQVVIDFTGDEARLQKAYDAAERSDKELRDSLAKTGKTGQTAAETIEREFNQSGDKSSKAYNKVLRELRKTGPEGRAAAAEVERHLRATGQAGRKDMQSIITSLGGLDDEAAEVAKNAARDFGKVEQAGDKAFGKGAAQKLGEFAAEWGGVAGMLASVNGHLVRQNELNKESLELNIGVAKAQQEAAKNLAGMTVVQQNELLQNAVPEIASQTGFADLSGITTAIGAAVSRGADPEQAREATTAAARMERLTPDNIDETAAGAVAVKIQTGLADVRQAISLLQTTGTQAAITSPDQLMQSAPIAIGSALATVPGQDREEASRQAGAMFATLTQFGNDEQGKSSATFQIDLANRMSGFFGDLEKQRVDARSELVQIERKKDPLEKDVARADELRELIPQLERISDPGKLFERLEVLQKNQAVGEAFIGEGFGEKRFQSALAGLLDEQSDVMETMRRSFASVRADTDFFEETVSRTQGATPQLQLSAAKSRGEASSAALKFSDIEGSALAGVRDIVKQAMVETTTNDAAGFAEGKIDQFITGGTFGIGSFQVPFPGGALPGTTAAEEGVSGIAVLQRRLQRIRQDGVDDSEARLVDSLEANIENLSGLVSGLADKGLDRSSLEAAAERARSSAATMTLPDKMRNYPETADSARDQAAVLLRLADVLEKQIASNERTNRIQEQQLEASRQTAANTSPDKKQPPNYAAGLQAGANAADRP